MKKSHVLTCVKRIDVVCYLSEYIQSLVLQKECLHLVRVPPSNLVYGIGIWLLDFLHHV